MGRVLFPVAAVMLALAGLVVLPVVFYFAWLGILVALHGVFLGDPPGPVLWIALGVVMPLVLLAVAWLTIVRPLEVVRGYAARLRHRRPADTSPRR